MGIDIATTPLLVKSASFTRVEGEALMLGRQTLVIPNRRAERFNQLMMTHGFETSLNELAPQKPRYSEKFFDLLGIQNIRSMDATSYEGSDIVQDLNLPINSGLTNRFSYIFDGGTLEHVFNVPNALDSVHNMLKPGGIFVSTTPGDGWFGHGFWQMSPEVVFSYWGTARGYELLEVKEVPTKPRQAPFTIPDPRLTGNRAKRRTGPGSAYLWYIVRKPMKQIEFTIPQQSDYQTIWDNDGQDD